MMRTAEWLEGLTEEQQGAGLVDAENAVFADTDVHDVAVTGISAPSWVLQGDLVSVDVDVANEGTYEETFDVVLAETPDGFTDTQPVTLAAASTIVSFSWQTSTSTTLGDHTLTATAGPVPGETDVADNSKATTVTVQEVGTNTMYAESIVFSGKKAGKNLTLYTTVTVVDEGGAPFAGVRVEMTLDHTSGSGGFWNFAGDTGEEGTVKFTRSKTEAGDYTATVTGLTYDPYTWDTGSGVISASCTLNADGTVTQGPAKALVLTPAVHSLGDNYPNPANPETNISYSLGQSGRVVLRVYNSLSQVIRTLVDEFGAPGTYTVRWDGRDDRGMAVSSGVYLYQLRADGYVETRKLALAR